MSEYIVIFVTVGKEEEAQNIAHTLISENLIACVNMVKDIRSLYKWQGNICDDKEILLIMKSKKELLNKIIYRVKSLHSYDTPEIIAVPIVGGYQEYLKWIDNEI